MQIRIQIIPSHDNAAPCTLNPEGGGGTWSERLSAEAGVFGMDVDLAPKPVVVDCMTAGGPASLQLGAAIEEESPEGTGLTAYLPSATKAHVRSRVVIVELRITRPNNLRSNRGGVTSAPDPARPAQMYVINHYFPLYIISTPFTCSRWQQLPAPEAASSPSPHLLPPVIAEPLLGVMGLRPAARPLPACDTAGPAGNAGPMQPLAAGEVESVKRETAAPGSARLPPSTL